MRRRALSQTAAIICGVWLGSGAASLVVAQDIGSLEAAMIGHVCPADRTKYTELTPRDAGCKTVCLDPRNNGGDCGGEGKLVGYEIQCAQQVREKNEVIRAYNRFVESCSRSQPAQSTKNSTPTSKPTAEKPSPDSKASGQTDKSGSGGKPSWAERAREMEQKSAGADEANKKNASSASQKARQVDRELVDERARLAEQERINNERRRQIELEEQLAGLNCHSGSGGRVCYDHRLADYSFRCVTIGGVNTLVLSTMVQRMNLNNVFNVNQTNCGVTNSQYIRMP